MYFTCFPLKLLKNLTKHRTLRSSSVFNTKNSFKTSYFTCFPCTNTQKLTKHRILLHSSVFKIQNTHFTSFQRLRVRQSSKTTYFTGFPGLSSLLYASESTHKYTNHVFYEFPACLGTQTPTRRFRSKWALAYKSTKIESFS